jgi:ABC-type transporter Mla subunit MlaD
MKKTDDASKDPFYYKHKNFFVGLFVLVPLLVIPALLMFILIKSEILEHWVELHMKCETGTGLKKSTNVNILGNAVGHVQTVTLNEKGYVDVTIQVKKRYSHFIHKDSKAYLKQKNFVVGDWEIDLTIGSQTSQPISDGDTLAVEYQIRLEKMVEVFTQMMEPFESLIQSLNRGEGILKFIFGEDTLMSDVHVIFGRIHGLFTEINHTLKNANAMIDNLALLGTRGVETVDTLMVFSQQANRLIENVNIVVDDMDTLVNRLGSLPEGVDSLMIMLKDELREADILLKGLQNHWLLKRSIEKRLRLEEKKFDERE